MATSVSEWSTTPGSNTALSAVSLVENVMTVKSVNNAIRELMAEIAAYTRAGSDLATAATLNLDSVDALFLNLTGTTTVTAVTLTEGHSRRARAAGAFQLTASASLIVNGSTSVNYTTTAGDLLFFEGYASSVVRVWTVTGGSATPSDASTTTKGIIEIATAAETLAGTDTSRAVVPANLYFPTGHVSPSLTISKNGTDASNDLDISAFTARDSSDSYNIVCSALTKQADTAWAVGTNAGSLDTGSVGNSTYYIWGIKRSDTSVCDVLTSLSSSAPTMPANYDAKVLIGEFTRAGGVNGIPIVYGNPLVRFSGSAPTFACRAWVNFNGTGTVAIRASGNVSSITDNGTGDYTVNFTTAMPDANYVVVPGIGNPTNTLVANLNVTGAFASSSPTTSAFRLVTLQVGVGVADATYVNVGTFR